MTREGRGEGLDLRSRYSQPFRFTLALAHLIMQTLQGDLTVCRLESHRVGLASFAVEADFATVHTGFDHLPSSPASRFEDETDHGSPLLL
jgi:hypothetical protein